MKHVVVVNQFALPRTEAGGTRHIDLFSRLEGWTPLIVAANRNHYSQMRYATDDPRFRLLRVPRQAGRASARLVGWMIFGFQAFAVCVARRQADLFFGSSPQPFAALAAMVAARVRRRPFVLEVRDLWPESIVAAGRLTEGSLVHQIFCALERLLARSAVSIVCVTDGWQEHFTRLGVPADRLVVVPNGTEPSDFVLTQSRQELRNLYSINGFTAVFAGAHGPMNAIDLILDTAQAMPDVNFLLVGSGPAKEGHVRRARQEGLSNVDFRDPMPKQEMAGLLRACDVGMHTIAPLAVLDQGMSPNKLFDYMAAELPIVSNAVTGLTRVVRDGECGRIGASDELTDCLRDVRAASPDQRATWGSRAGSIIGERFSRQAAAAVLKAALDAAGSTIRRAQL